MLKTDVGDRASRTSTDEADDSESLATAIIYGERDDKKASEDINGEIRPSSHVNHSFESFGSRHRGQYGDFSSSDEVLMLLTQATTQILITRAQKNY